MKKAFLFSALTVLALVASEFWDRSTQDPPVTAVKPCTTKPQIQHTAPTAPQQVAAIPPQATVQAEPEEIPAAPEQPTEALQPEKLAQQLQNIATDYKELAQAIYDQSPPLIRPEDRQKLSFLENEKVVDLAKLLSPSELDLLQNTIDPTTAPRRR